MYWGRQYKKSIANETLIMLMFSLSFFQSRPPSKGWSMVQLVQPHLDWRSLLFQIVSCMSTSLQGVFISCLLCFCNPDVSTILRCFSLSLSGNSYKNSWLFMSFFAFSRNNSKYFLLSMSSFAFVVVFVSATLTSPSYSGASICFCLAVKISPKFSF